MARTTLGLALSKEAYDLPMKVVFRLGGAGYRVMAKLNAHRSRKWERLWVYATRPTKRNPLPLDIWLGQGCPLNPYLKGRIVDIVRNELKPQDSKFPPARFVSEADQIILEGSLYYEWMRQYLKWVRWYALVALDPDPRLDDLLDPPVVETSWKGRSTEHKQYHKMKFGLLWKLYDLVSQDPTWVPGILGPGRDHSECSVSYDDVLAG